MGYEVKNVTLSFQLGLIVFWRLFPQWWERDDQDADLIFGNDNIFEDAQIQTRGGDKNRPFQSASLPWDFPFLFACLYKDFFFSKKTWRSWKKALWNSSAMVSWITPSSTHLKNRFDFLSWAVFFVLDNLELFFLQVVKNESDKKQEDFLIWQDAFSATAIKLMPVYWVFNWRHWWIRHGAALIYLAQKQTWGWRWTRMNG